MIIDLHSHTCFSFDSTDEPEKLVLKMIEKGVQVFGITDHSYGIKGREKEYIDTVNALKDKYRDSIDLYCGVEIATVPRFAPNLMRDVSAYDYCLIEQLDSDDNLLGTGLFEYVKSLDVKAGIAHTDLFELAKTVGMSARKFFSEMKACGVFWEMNVNFDSIHGYREHAYVKDFFTSPEKQSLIKDIGVEISVGFDGHRMNDYDVARVKSACDFLENNGFNLVKGF